jgi:alpha-glucosidase (family GH31 glycosyl hydrolase)
VSAIPRPARGVVEMGDSFASSRGEGFFGFGGRHNAVNQHGQTFTSFVSEEDLDHYQGHRGLYPGGATAAYYPQAEFFSSRPYGFLLAQPQLARFKLDVSGHRAWNVSAVARSLNYVVAPGGAAKAIRTLTALSGRQPAPPRWALGPMLDRLVKNFGETTADYETQVSTDLANLQRFRMPVTAYRLEGWTFPGTSDNFGLSLHSYVTSAFQRSVFSALRARGIHPLVYLRPWLTPGSVGVHRGYEVRTARGAPYYTTSTAGVKIALLDFTNPAAVRYWQGLVARALDTGASGFMQDFGEEVLFGMHFHNGQTGVTMHNEYPVLYDRATRQELRRYSHAHPGRGGFFFFTRAGYSGEPGSAAYESANFPGDETTDFSQASGLASLTSDMLGRAVDGAYGYGTDIGGYYDLTTPPTTKQLFLRWAEWAALSPVFRLHGSGIHGTHTPWSFDAQTVSVYRSLSELHLRAATLILRLWRQADRTGIPITRPLWLVDPRDRKAWNQDQEWLLGPDLLVAPVVKAGASARGVFFPSGCWRGDGKLVHGPRSASVTAPLTVLPYFTRCGTHPLRRGS